MIKIVRTMDRYTRSIDRSTCLFVVLCRRVVFFCFDFWFLILSTFESCSKKSCVLLSIHFIDHFFLIVIVYNVVIIDIFCFILKKKKKNMIFFRSKPWRQRTHICFRSLAVAYCLVSICCSKSSRRNTSICYWQRISCFLEW